MFGSEVIARVQRISPGIWFNTYVSISGTVCSSPTVTQKTHRLIFAVCKSIKYGVTTVDNLCSDLLSWNTLYLSGRMHKPIRIIKDDARVRLTQQVNLVSALRVALLTLPDEFDEKRLFERIAGFSYAGDPRMSVPGGENRGKVANIVSAQAPQFRELYQRLANGLPSVHWRVGSSTIEASSLAFFFVDMSFGSRMSYFFFPLQQDTSARARAALLRKLPSNLFHRLETKYATDVASLGPEAPSYENDPSAFWTKVGADKRLADNIDSGAHLTMSCPYLSNLMRIGIEMRAIVRWPATVQSLKGVITTGAAKSVRYGVAKVGKWWRS